jgi:hypothetical protein
METFADTSAFNAGVKEKNTKTKLQLLKIKNLQHKSSFLTCIYIFPLVTYKDFLLSESNLHFPHPAFFGRSGCRLFNSTVIFLPDVSDVWRWPNPVKTNLHQVHLIYHKKENKTYKFDHCIIAVIV